MVVKRGQLLTEALPVVTNWRGRVEILEQQEIGARQVGDRNPRPLTHRQRPQTLDLPREHRLGGRGILFEEKGLAGVGCEAGTVIDAAACNWMKSRNRTITLRFQPCNNRGRYVQISPASSASSRPRTERSTMR